MYACESPRPSHATAIKLLNSTIEDMEIKYNRGGTLNEKNAIQSILWSLRESPQLCQSVVGPGSLDYDRSHDLIGNVTVALFASMGLTPRAEGEMPTNSEQVLMMYLQLLGFVFLYYFIVAALAMFMFSIFIFLTYRRSGKKHKLYAIASRVVLGGALLSLIAVMTNFDLAYGFMTSPVILFTFSIALLIGEFVGPIYIHVQFFLSFITGFRCSLMVMMDDVALWTDRLWHHLPSSRKSEAPKAPSQFLPMNSLEMHRV